MWMFLNAALEFAGSMMRADPALARALMVGVAASVPVP